MQKSNSNYANDYTFSCVFLVCFYFLQNLVYAFIWMINLLLFKDYNSLFCFEWKCGDWKKMTFVLVNFEFVIVFCIYWNHEVNMSNLLICDSDVVGWEWSFFQDQEKHSIEEAYECLLWPTVGGFQLHCFSVWWTPPPSWADSRWVGNGGRGRDWCHASPDRRFCCLKDVITFALHYK